MPHRSFKSMLIELLSFLTLFTLVGTMTSNFWERYLIQNELSNMKSSLHILKETIFNIGAAYDNLNHELKGLIQMKKVRSSKSMPRDSLKIPSCCDHTSSNDLNVLSNKVLEELIKLKANKSIGITACKGTDGRSIPQKEFKYVVKNATTVTGNPRKSIGTYSNRESIDVRSAEDISDVNNLQPNSHTPIHKCYKEANCKQPYNPL